MERHGAELDGDMVEVTNALIYEVLKAMQARLGNMDEGQREVRGELRAVRGNLQAVQTQMSAMQLDIGNLYESFTALDTRLARIERRLDIIDVSIA
jgi:chromosome segregation ATPase